MTSGSGTKDDPWQLKTRAGLVATTRCTATRPATRPRSSARSARRRSSTTSSAIDDLAHLAQGAGRLGAARCRRRAEAGRRGTVEAWGRSDGNPVGGWYGLRKGYRGRFGMYLPPLLEALGLAELTHDARNNSIRAL